MKKLLYSSIVLTVLSLSMIFFQISCTDDAMARTSAPEVGKLLYYTIESGKGTLWIADHSGLNATKVNVSLPGDFRIGEARLSPSGEKIFIQVNDSNGKGYIYSSNLDGSNILKVVDGSHLSNDAVRILGVY